MTWAPSAALRSKGSRQVPSKFTLGDHKRVTGLDKFHYPTTHLATSTTHLLEIRTIMTERQTILKTADKVPNYFLVKFTVDEALCVIPRKNIVDPNELSVNGRCLVK